MEKLRATMERIERGRWDEIRDKEEKIRRQEERRKGTKKEDKGTKKKGGLGGYIGAKVKPEWVGVLDTPAIVAEEEVKEEVEKKIEERERRIKKKTTKSPKSPKKAGKRKEVAKPVVDAYEAKGEDEVEEEEEYYEDEDSRFIDDDYEAGADILISASTATPRTSSMTPKSTSQATPVETPDTAIRTRMLEKKVEEVEMLVGRMKDVASRVEIRLQEAEYAKERAVPRERAAVPRELPRLMNEAEMTQTYRPIASPGRASPTQLKLANKVVNNLLAEDQDEDNYEDDCFENDDERKARNVAEVGYTLQTGGTPKRDKSNHISKIAKEMAKRSPEPVAQVPEVAKNVERWGMINSPGRVKVGGNKMQTRIMEAAKKIEEEEEEEEAWIEEEYPNVQVEWGKEAWEKENGEGQLWAEEAEDFGAGTFSVVDMFAAEIFRQKVEEEKRKIYEEADKFTGGRNKDKDDDAGEWSDDEREMLMLENTKDVVEGREPRVKVAMVKEKSPAKERSPAKGKSPAKAKSLVKDKSPIKKKSPVKVSASPKKGASIDEQSGEFEEGESSEEQGSDIDASGDYSMDYHDAEEEQTYEEEEDEGDDDEDEDEDESEEEEDDSIDTSASTSYTTTVSSPVRLTPSELQAQLLGELAVHDMLTEQILQLNEVEKTYTVSVAEAELVKVKGDWGKERDRLEMVEEMRAQQIAYENTLRMAVERAREIERADQQHSSGEEYESSSFESYQGTPKGVRTRGSRLSPKVHPSPSPATPATSVKSRLEQSASAYSEDFESSEEGSMFLDKTEGSLDNVSLPNGGWRKERDEVVKRRKEIEERMWKVRERAVKEVFKAAERDIEVNREFGEERKREEIKRAKRRRRESFAELNREKWQVRAMRIREEEVFDRLKTGVGGPGGEEDWIWRERFGAETIMGSRLDDSIEGSGAKIGRGYSTGSGFSEGEDESVIEMRSRLRVLKKKKEDAEKLIKKKRLQEEIKRLESPPPSVKRRTSDLSVGTGDGDDYYEESFESEDEKSIRSRRSTGSIRNRGMSKDGRMSRGESIEMDVQEDSSSSFDSVEEEVDKVVGKGEAEEASEVDEYSGDVSRDVSREGSSRRVGYARGGRSMASEVSEATGYGQESFESYDDRIDLGTEAKKSEAAAGVGRGVGLMVEVQDGGREVVGTLTNTLTNQSRGAERTGRKRKAKKRESFGVADMSRDKENESFGGNSEYSEEDLDASFDSIKGRIKDLQRKVARKNREQRKEEERKRLVELERRLLMELDGRAVEDDVGKEDEIEEEMTAAGSRRSISPGPSLSASALSSALGNSGFGKDISVVKGEQLVDESVQVSASLLGAGTGRSRDHREGSGRGEDVGSFLRDDPDPAEEEIESAVMSDSFRSRSSGEGSDDDDEKAVLRTERREMERIAAARLQTRVRGWKAREVANHRRAVVERMVRKARAEERERADKERYGLEEVEGEVAEEPEVGGRFDDLLGSESSQESFEQSLGLASPQKPINTEEEVENMVKTALLAASAVVREAGLEEEEGQGSPAPGLNESYVSGSSTDSDEIAARVQDALVEDSFASGFGESADLEGLLSSMAEEHAENKKTAMAAAEHAVDAIGQAASDIIAGLVIEELWVEAAEKGGEEEGEKITKAAVAVQRVGRGKIGRAKVKKGREEKEEKEEKMKVNAAVMVQKVGRGKLGRAQVGKRRVEKKRMNAAVTVQSAERARIGRIVAKQKKEKKDRENKEEVKRKVKENAEREAEEARKRIRKKAEEEKRAKLGEELKRKERVGEMVVKEILEKMVEEEVGGIGEMGGGSEWSGSSSLSGAPSLTGQHSVPMEGQEGEEEDDDIYDFGGGSGGIPGAGAQRQDDRIAVEFDWKGMEREYLEEVVEGVNWEKLSDHRWRVWRYEDRGREGKGDAKKRKKERKAIKKEKWSHIKGSVEDVLEDSFDPELSGSMSDGGDDEALPLGYFLRMEREKADRDQGRQMRRKAVFDCVNEVVGRRMEEVYGRVVMREGGEGVVVVGGIEGWVKGPEARKKRGRLEKGWVVKEVLNFINPKQMGPGIWDDGTTLSSRGVYEKGEGDEEWGAEAERREEEVREGIEGWIWEQELESAVVEMMRIRAAGA